MDIVSYLMGKAAGGGGSGGEKTLWTSGWIKQYGTYTEVDGDLVTMGAGGSSHWLQIAPPATAYRGNEFKAGDTVKVAVTVKNVSSRVYFSLINIPNGTAESATGFITIPSASQSEGYANKAGSDVITFHKTSGGGWLKIEPLAGSSTSSTATATVEITGLEYNGTLIFGSVTPPNP